MNFKKITSIAIVSVLLVFSSNAFSNVRIFACEPEWASLASELGGELVSIKTAITAFQDAHFIEARPSLIAAARNADMLFCSGAELEIAWLPLLLRQSGNSRIQEGEPGYFLAAEQVERIDIPEVLDRSMGDVHASGNPHVHLDPYRLLKVAQKFSQRLQVIDPENKKTYEQKLEHFSSRWQTAIESWEKKAAPLKDKRAFIQHGHSNYLINWLGIKVIDDLEPKPGLPPSSSHLAHLLNVSEESSPDFILLAAYQSDKGARWLSKRSEIAVVVLPFTVGGNEQVNDLFSLYDNTIALLLAEVD